VYRSLDDLCRALNESLPEPARDFFENELPTILPVVETCEKFEEGIAQGSSAPDPLAKSTPGSLSTGVAVSSAFSGGNKAMEERR
jgi:hypothetical protein